MTTELNGRSAILKHEIDRLEQEHELLCKQIADPYGSETIHCPHDQNLRELRQELKRELSMKRVAVFGTAHGLQEKGDSENPEMQSRLSYLIGKFAATIIMEEWAADCPASLASTLANDRIVYTNVGTPPEEQFRTFANAPISYPGHDGTLGPCEDAPQMYEYGPLDKQENRERRMVQNVQDAMKDHRVGLFIVGLAHLHSISAKLKEAGFNVAAYAWTGSQRGTSRRVRRTNRFGEASLIWNSCARRSRSCIGSGRIGLQRRVLSFWGVWTPRGPGIRR